MGRRERTSALCPPPPPGLTRQADDDCGPFSILKSGTIEDWEFELAATVGHIGHDGAVRLTYWDFEIACRDARRLSLESSATYWITSGLKTIATFSAGTFRELEDDGWKRRARMQAPGLPSQYDDAMQMIDCAQNYRPPEEPVGLSRYSIIVSAREGAWDLSRFVGWCALAALWFVGFWLIVLVGMIVEQRWGTWEGYFDFLGWSVLGAMLSGVVAGIWGIGLLLATFALRGEEYLRETANMVGSILNPLQNLREWIEGLGGTSRFNAEWDSIPSAAGMRYETYLQSSQWKARRKYILTAGRHRCQVCSSKDALHVHHRSYKRLGDERIDDLVVLCKTCHDLFHQNGRMPVRL